ncbi:MAG: hypothetical protein A3I61_11120 [Acidobacteria bacterium RIFCSPLOWO2_02_FULL_68_18]|nr:MAG: hypothetical protein A3I61_11120 [Acidobacteria bacterium RIFCSPLOWO2_02_FULL_68_18]OFW50621.1 MAG: hypothetical protein A3G77_16865 [Acidobacteria bacterium RIFCSPLOWO2_12_FULL_68_19]
MKADKEIDSFREHNNEPYVWYLPDRFTPPPTNWYGRKHELDIADLFVSYFPHITHWDTEWGVLERDQLNIPRYRVNYDARMVLSGKVYLWEVDRGTEDMDVQLEPKIDKYIELAKSLPYGSFQVILTLQKYRRMNVGNRAGRLVAMLQEKERGNQFLVALHSDVKADPIGAVFVSPRSPERKARLSDFPYGNV